MTVKLRLNGNFTNWFTPEMRGKKCKNTNRLPDTIRPNAHMPLNNFKKEHDLKVLFYNRVNEVFRPTALPGIVPDPSFD